MRLPYSKLTFAVTTNSLLSMMPAGYHLLVLNNPQTIIENFVSKSFASRYGYELSGLGLYCLWAFIVACLAIGALFGCFWSVWWSSKFGRKRTLMIWNNIILFLASFFYGISKAVNAFECLIVGRLLSGMFAGAAVALSAAFINECSPSDFRGPLSCLLHTCMTLGCAVGAILGVDELLGTDDLWPYLLAFPATFGVIQLFFVPFIRESPKWLHFRDPFCERAITAVHYYHGPYVDAKQMLESYDREAREAPEEITFSRAMKLPPYRNRMFLGALVNFAQVFTGLMAIVSYSTVILTSLGISSSFSQYITAVGCVLCVFLSLPALYLVEHTGRRKLLISTLFALTIINCCLVVSGVMVEDGIGGTFGKVFFVGSALAFLIAYNLGPGPIAYFICGELAPQAIRSSFLAVGVCVNWTSTMISTFIFYPLDALVGSYCFLMFVFPTALSTFLLWKKLPETKGRAITAVPDDLDPLSLSYQDASDQIRLLNDSDWSESDSIPSGNVTPKRQPYGTFLQS